MPRWTAADEAWDDDREGDEDFDSDEDDSDLEDDDEPTVDCPYCGAEILEEAQRCPHCGEYLSREDAPLEKKPWWILLGVGLCLYIVFRWIFI